MRRFIHVRIRSDRGMSTAEYAVGTVAAVSFATALFHVINSPAVFNMLVSLLSRAFHPSF